MRERDRARVNPVWSPGTERGGTMAPSFGITASLAWLALLNRSFRRGTVLLVSRGQLRGDFGGAAVFNVSPVHHEDGFPRLEDGHRW